ncbi:CpaF family protein [Paenibacillaceae bacterium]|nr:CpaF family protein [Paenibacillaceae bacterium]
MNAQSHPETERFSPSTYASNLAPTTLDTGDTVTVAPQELDFQRVAEDIRGYLATPRGSTAEERGRYNERLNRAVLGFSEERSEILAIISDRLIRQRIHKLPGYDHLYNSLAEALFAEVIGLHVLELILQHKDGLEEVQVIGTKIFEVRNGRVIPSQHAFKSKHEVERIQQNLVLYNNDRINPRKRWAEVMLTDGSRVTMTGFGFTSEPTLTLRFYTVRHFDLWQLCAPELGTMNKRIACLLLAILEARLNIVIIGPTNSGKTHLLKALISALPDEERIITIEGRHEMMLRRDFPAKNIVEYETEEDDELHRSAQAFKLALRQSPQRIVHAEIRDDDANIYVRACTRGHSGSMTTVHANELEDVPEAVADMCMLDGRVMNSERLLKRIANFVTQIGIQMRNDNGQRRIERIGLLRWLDGEVEVADWVKYDERQRTWIYPEQLPLHIAHHLKPLHALHGKEAM